jgi:23S rRNA (cytidine1920-2'-O)/16S rRNA (cytidine1409-2'-O)-methyltransferase
VLLVKPQFEAPPGAVPPGGVVTDAAVRRAAIERVASAAAGAGAGTLAVMTSPIPGPAGNVEFLLHARRGAGSAVADPGAVAEAGR